MTRHWVVIAPARAERPGASTPPELGPASQEELDSCPFCEGREQRTPPETFALRPGGGKPDTPGWSVRVVPNLYPVFEHHEVVVSTPRHARSFAELGELELDGVATAWRERARAAKRAGFAYVHALLNEGTAAGASLLHSHTQLVWLDELPPAVRAEEEGADCALCRQLGRELERGERIISDRDGFVVLAAFGGRLPYELLLAPREHPQGSAFESALLPAALRRLAESLRRLHAVEGVVPVNAWLHDHGHWHLELLPRLSVLAGIELGAGIYVNSLAPEDAAALLRGAD
ncbi:MAG TPA: DUF4921 family protein [Gaiellaceae bacterium]